MTALNRSIHAEETSADVFGFWIYIMSDCLLFASLFATFIVLHHNTYGGLGMKQITDLTYVFTETLLLLLSSFTCGMAMLALYKNQQRPSILWLLLTFLLGLSFVVMEIKEFLHLIMAGHGPSTSAAMSAFFTLVGTHGLHVSIGLLWMLVLVAQLFFFKVTPATCRRMICLGLFWAFLDIVWIFVFTVVYLMGVV